MDVPRKTGPVSFGWSLSTEWLDDLIHQFDTSEHTSKTEASRVFYLCASLWVGDAILGTLPDDKLWNEASQII